MSSIFIKDFLVVFCLPSIVVIGIRFYGKYYQYRIYKNKSEYLEKKIPRPNGEFRSFQPRSTELFFFAVFISCVLMIFSSTSLILNMDISLKLFNWNRNIKLFDVATVFTILGSLLVTEIMVLRYIKRRLSKNKSIPFKYKFLELIATGYSLFIANSLAYCIRAGGA